MHPPGGQEERMETHEAITNEILNLEKRYWQAIKDKDAAAAMNLTDESCLITGAQGVSSMDRQALEGMLKNANYTLRDFEVKDPHVRLVHDDVAVLAYRVHKELTVEGKPVSFDAAEASTWVRRNGQWKCALHAESIAGDPFGRDRRPPAKA